MTATISPEHLAAARATRPVLVIDVRTPGEYAALHAPDTRSLPLDRFDPAALPAPADGAAREVYVLCATGARAESAAARIAAAGRHEPVVVAGGIAAWAAAGLPVVRGRGPIPLERQVRLGAGLLVLLSLVLAWTVHRNYLGIAAFIGAGLVFSGVTGFCGMALLLARMPWNRGSASCGG